MSTSSSPTNYNWTNNTLTYDLPLGTQGLKLKYKQDGQSEWLVVYESMFSAPNSCVLPSELGPSGTIMGATLKTVLEGWGEPKEETITNHS
ncbi:MAG: hypothetical protein WC121_06515 [Candidatus Kapaibacterium sp.]